MIFFYCDNNSGCCKSIYSGTTNNFLGCAEWNFFHEWTKPIYNIIYVTWYSKKIEVHCCCYRSTKHLLLCLCGLYTGATPIFLFEIWIWNKNGLNRILLGSSEISKQCWKKWLRFQNMTVCIRSYSKCTEKFDFSYNSVYFKVHSWIYV